MTPKLNEMTLEQLKIIIDEAVQDKIDEILGDPDHGLELREEVIQRLKAQRKAKKPRIPMAEVAKKHGFELR